jgi:hypothetical protein
MRASSSPNVTVPARSSDRSDRSRAMWPTPLMLSAD